MSAENPPGPEAINGVCGACCQRCNGCEFTPYFPLSCRKKFRDTREFLSRREILEIIRQFRDPQRVEEELKRLVENKKLTIYGVENLQEDKRRLAGQLDREYETIRYLMVTNERLSRLLESTNDRLNKLLDRNQPSHNVAPVISQVEQVQMPPQQVPNRTFDFPPPFDLPGISQVEVQNVDVPPPQVPSLSIFDLPPFVLPQISQVHVQNVDILPQQPNQQGFDLQPTIDLPQISQVHVQNVDILPQQFPNQQGFDLQPTIDLPQISQVQGQNMDMDLPALEDVADAT